jgi:uncharacterized protein YbcI
MRECLREMYSKETEEFAEMITGNEILSNDSDISTKMGESIEMYVLDKDLEKTFGNSEHCP